MVSDWIKVHRSALESQVFSDPFLWHMFCWCLMKANWKDGYFRGELVPRGSFVSGRESGAAALSISESKFRRNLAKLVGLGCITTKATNRFTVIRIEKYEAYQSGDGLKRPTDEPATDQQMNQPPTIQRPTDEPATDHNRRREEGEELEEGKERNKQAGVRLAATDLKSALPQRLDTTAMLEAVNDWHMTREDGHGRWIGLNAIELRSILATVGQDDHDDIVMMVRKAAGARWKSLYPQGVKNGKGDVDAALERMGREVNHVS